MANFNKGLFLGIIIGAFTTTLVNKADVNALLDKDGTASYASSFLYRNTAPSIGEEYLKETPILKAVVDDIEWNVSVDEKYGTLYYEGVFNNWTDVDINQVKLELRLLSLDNVLLDSTHIYLDNIKSKEKVLAKIELPRSYNDYVSTVKDLKIEVVGKSRDFKDKPFSKEQIGA